LYLGKVKVEIERKWRWRVSKAFNPRVCAWHV